MIHTNYWIESIVLENYTDAEKRRRKGTANLTLADNSSLTCEQSKEGKEKKEQTS